MPTPVTPKGRRTRRQLLDAGEAVVDRGGLADLSVGAVTAEAGLAKGTFYVHFNDRAEFVAALRKRFYAEVEDALLASVAGVEPGRGFLLAVIESYLNVCLAHRGVKALILEARPTADDASLTELTTRFTAFAEPSLTALALTPADLHARFILALMAEAVAFEVASGKRDPAARGALSTWIRAASTPPAP